MRVNAKLRAMIWVVALLSTVFPIVARAGFGHWDYETENDPFSGGRRITAANMDSLRSGVVILCDSAKKKLIIRAIPGFVFSSGLDWVAPKIKIAIDGEIILDNLVGTTGVVGDNMAVSEVELTEDDAAKFVGAFKNAKRQIAVQDGISDRPQLLTAVGSTETGRALVACVL